MHPAARSAYVVLPGDTLWGIAQWAYGDPTAAGAIARANHVPKSGLILVGQTLRLPTFAGRDDHGSAHHGLAHHGRHSGEQAASYAAPPREPGDQDALIWSESSGIPGERAAVPIGVRRDLRGLTGRAFGPGYMVSFELKGELALIPKDGLGLSFDITELRDPQLVWERASLVRSKFALASTSFSLRRQASGDRFDFSCAYTVSSLLDTRPFLNLRVEVAGPLSAKISLEPQPVKGRLDADTEFEGSIGFEATITILPPARLFEPVLIPSFVPVPVAAKGVAGVAGIELVVMISEEIVSLTAAAGAFLVANPELALMAL